MRSVSLCQLYVYPQNRLSAFHVAGDIPSIFVRPQDSLSIFIASADPFVNFHQFSLRSLNLPSTSINILCGRGTFRQLFVHPRELSPTFHASEGPSINFPDVRGRSVNFRQLSVHLRYYPSNSRVSV